MICLISTIFLVLRHETCQITETVNSKKIIDFFREIKSTDIILTAKTTFLTSMITEMLAISNGKILILYSYYAS